MLALFSNLSFIAILGLAMIACSTTADVSPTDETLIDNPFKAYSAKGGGGENQNITVRARRGDRAVEIELPNHGDSDFSVPMDSKPTTAAGANLENGIDYSYFNQKASGADREIASTFASTSDPATETKKREIESNLGLQISDEPFDLDESYLAKVDVVKQLFSAGRFEAALLEIDGLIKRYPTNGKLFEMRGTLLDRIGYTDLALRSWKQAFEFAPHKLSLKKMIDRREQQRSVASEKH